ncbi:metallophosphoesterase family protein [Caproiciproducens sp.]
MDWKKEVERLKFQENMSWTEIARKLAPKFPGLTETQIREKIRAPFRNRAKEDKEVADDQILSVLKVKRTAQQDADILHMSITSFVRACDRLSSDGYNITEASNLIWLEKAAVASSNELHEDYSGETEITFGVIGDTHLCNKSQQLTYLNDFYDRCQRQGISTIYHCGDISDGYYKNRPEHIYELFKIGFDEQAEYIIDKYPKRDGVTTKFITGNHDATHIKNGGSDIGKRIADQRPDMKYLGYMKAKIWLTPQCDMDLFHPLDGGSYALSYQLQKHIDGLQGGKKPRLLMCGHYHKQFYMMYRNIHAFVVPCFEAQTNFELGKHLNAVVGGWIITIKCKPDGTITELSPKFIPYYDMTNEDY